MSDSIPPINGMNMLINDAIGLQLESIGTQATVSAMSNQITANNQSLAAKWNTCDESNPSDPAYAAWYYLQLAQQNQKGDSNPPPTPPGPAPTLPNGQQAPTSAYSSVDAWIDYFLQGDASGIPASKMSSIFLTEVYNAYMNSNPSEQDIHLGLVSSVSSWITSASASDEKSGQNEISLTNTLAQHFITDQGPLSNISSAVIDTANSYSTAMQSISA